MAKRFGEVRDIPLFRGVPIDQLDKEVLISICSHLLSELDEAKKELWRYKSDLRNIG